MEIRPARPDDASELVRLRQMMFDAMRVLPGDPAWEASCRVQLEAGLDEARLALSWPTTPNDSAGWRRAASPWLLSGFPPR
jgi:hypothetical protein